MKKTRILVAVLGLCFSLSANAQLAKQKDITIEQISQKINELANSEDKSAKDQLKLEAKALAESTSEEFMDMASKIYKFIGEDAESVKVAKEIEKKFPKGLVARAKAFKDKLFDAEDLTAAKAEQVLASLVKEYPKASFTKKGIYDEATATIAHLYYKEGNTTKANALITSIKSSPSFARYTFPIVKDLVENKKEKLALPILEEIYNQSKVVGSESERYVYAIMPIYIKSLAENGNSKKIVELVDENLKGDSWFASTSQIAIEGAKAYQKEGRNQDAFSLLTTLIENNGISDEVVAEIKSVYSKLGNKKESVETFLVNAEKTFLDNQLSLYEKKMISKDAPDFSIVDKNGKKVSLADYKGKVLVLDFWATWCGPCVQSFPGMQAAANKYKNDKDVAFLFVNTWQREKNYMEVVDKFLTKKGYTFDVAFDEMKDASKAMTTAYGVQGIPHKVVIDKQGKIRFESSGSSPETSLIIAEMDAKIKLAKKG